MDILNQKFNIIIACDKDDDNVLNDVRDWLKSKLDGKVDNVYLTIGNFGMTNSGRIFEGQLLIRANSAIDAAMLKNNLETPSDLPFRFEKIEKA